MAGGELRGVCGDFILSLKPTLFYVSYLEAAPRALSTWSSEPREGQAV